MHGRKQAPPASWVFVTIGKQEPDRPASLLGELFHPGEFVLLVVEIAVHAECTDADRAESGADAQKLVGIGVARRYEFAGWRLVRVGARGGEAEGACMQRLDG